MARVAVRAARVPVVVRVARAVRADKATVTAAGADRVAKVAVDRVMVREDKVAAVAVVRVEAKVAVRVKAAVLAIPVKIRTNTSISTSTDMVKAVDRERRVVKVVNNVACKMLRRQHQHRYHLRGYNLALSDQRKTKRQPEGCRFLSD